MYKARKEREHRRAGELDREVLLPMPPKHLPPAARHTLGNKPFRHAHSLVNSAQTCECRHKGLSSVEECQRRSVVESRSVVRLSSVEECQRRSVRQGHQKAGQRRAV
jgi:hypothetical protein